MARMPMNKPMLGGMPMGATAPPPMKPRKPRMPKVAGGVPMGNSMPIQNSQPMVHGSPMPMQNMAEATPRPFGQ